MPNAEKTAALLLVSRFLFTALFPNNIHALGRPRVRPAFLLWCWFGVLRIISASRWGLTLRWQPGKSEGQLSYLQCQSNLVGSNNHPRWALCVTSAMYRGLMSVPTKIIFSVQCSACPTMQPWIFTANFFGRFTSYKLSPLSLCF